ncbi:MAG: hypothetical protein KKA37_08075 [Alphaproteobacteria bacterium]|jgi:uncharacterized membrane protein|nr:hypothetical protein [Alphaproteobacteria bacterium]MBU2041949.1 hypothetical protein [Alphaproteobacteria bacterium]MBU2125103.1 hypothetical protein [Alphaproteobacteria bacterium]MBU2207191.1 hypothetical protein [Alphaproteobacteria bacterium]MBU2397749.1 hypothetical protein [Alphaproteobacteria bacterium]
MTQAVLFMAIVPAALGAVLLFALVTGYVSERVRERIQWAMVLTGHPLAVIWFGWEAWERQQRAEWLGFSLFLLGAGLFAAQFIQWLRSGALSSGFRNQKA